MLTDCIFCKIVSGIFPSTIVVDTQDLLVIKDIYPKASVHYLIIPKKHITNVGAITESDRDLMGSIMFMAQRLSQLDGTHHEFRLIANNGARAGQSVFHLHVHFLAGNGIPGF